MSCPCCFPTIESRLREMLRIIKVIPGVQHGHDEIMAATWQHAEVGQLIQYILLDLQTILNEELGEE